MTHVDLYALFVDFHQNKKAKNAILLLITLTIDESKQQNETEKEIKTTSEAALEDFCDAELCKFHGEEQPRKHVACESFNESLSSCPQNASLIEFTPAEQTLILKYHNIARNFIAFGGNTCFQPARRMAFMQWDRTLEYVASFNVRSCHLEHDVCRNTRQFKYSGQNLGIRETSKRALSRHEMMRHFIALIKAWIAEGSLFCDHAFIDSFHPHPNAEVQIGHFTEIVRDANPFCGCSAMEFSNDTNWFYLIACNYATNNFFGEKVYEAGASCSACLTGCHSKYKALCSENESFLT